MHTVQTERSLHQIMQSLEDARSLLYRKSWVDKNREFAMFRSGAYWTFLFLGSEERKKELDQDFAMGHGHLQSSFDSLYELRKYLKKRLGVDTSVVYSELPAHYHLKDTSFEIVHNPQKGFWLLKHNNLFVKKEGQPQIFSSLQSAANLAYAMLDDPVLFRKLLG